MGRTSSITKMNGTKRADLVTTSWVRSLGYTGPVAVLEPVQEVGKTFYTQAEQAGQPIVTTNNLGGLDENLTSASSIGTTRPSRLA